MLQFFEKLSKKYKDALWRLRSDAPAAVVLDKLANSAALNTVQGRGSGSRVSLPGWIPKTSIPVLGTKSSWEAGKAEVASHRLSDFLCFCLQIIFY